MNPQSVIADVSGTVWKILVAAGDRVEAEQELMILESMKMEIPALAPCAGVVQSLSVAEGEAVNEGQVLAVLQAG